MRGRTTGGGLRRLRDRHPRGPGRLSGARSPHHPPCVGDVTTIDAHDVPVDGVEWRDLVRGAGWLEHIRREIVAHRGAIVASRRPIRKHSCGYDLLGLTESLDRGVFPLASLFVGSEGTLGVVTEATLRVLPIPARRITLLLYLDRFEDLGPAVGDS